MTTPENAPRLVVQVVAGLEPGQPDESVTHSWELPSGKGDGATPEEWAAVSPEERLALAATLVSEAYGYAGAVMVRPERATWGRVEWRWG